MEHTKRSQANKEAILTRLNRISGQIEGLKNMVNEDRYCNDILIQIRAVRNSLKSLANLILNDHLHHCVVDKIQKGDLTVLDEISELLRRDE